MQEILYEETSVCQRTAGLIAKYKTLNVLSIIFLFVTVCWLVFAVSFFPLNIDNVLISIIIILLPSIISGSTCYLLIRFRVDLIVDYDYSVVGDEIRISKIKGNRKRIHVVNFTSYMIECMGKVGSKTFEKYDGQPNIQKYYYTKNELPSEKKGFFYIVASVESEKKLMILDCTERILACIIKTAKSTTLERDYK